MSHKAQSAPAHSPSPSQQAEFKQQVVTFGVDVRLLGLATGLSIQVHRIQRPPPSGLHVLPRCYALAAKSRT
jgi:hypothetical protein